MRIPRMILAAGAALALSSTMAMANAPDNDKLRADLPDVLAAAQPNELVPITIVMKEQAEPFNVAALEAMDKADRRAYVIETLKAVAQESQAGLLAQLHQAEHNGQASMINPLWLANVVAVRVTPQTALAIAARDDVDYLSYDHPVGEEVFPRLPVTENGQLMQRGIECGVNLMNAPIAWANGFTGQGVVVGMIDTGLCISHPDIVNQLWDNPGEIAGNGIDDDNNGFVDDIHGWSWDFNGSNNNINDNNGHGSHTSGTVAGDGTQGTQAGMAPDANIQVLKFWNNLSGESSVWNGMQYGVANGADVLSASLGWLHQWNPDRVTWRNLSENTFASGVVVVFAAGNEGSSFGIDSVRTPGDVPDMITVGATDCNMNAASFSSRGPVTWENVNPFNDWPYPPGKLKPTICAPGVSTVSHNFCNGYISFSGTSMATPHVAGTVALMLQANPNLDHYQVKQILKNIAIDRGQSGPDNTYGAGFVDAWAAVQAALDAACDVDINGDGMVDTQDVTAFLNLWNLNSPNADFDDNGVIDTRDVLAFLNAWVAGC